ncbi:DNA-binding transcriptional regulator YhcF (GntR family) [Bradyrhizobium yuanmingense]|uniref:helix-turn-helix domain-containing protein n=1 Tax=Bradyrhizobium yuanmingense TaxID=108015 RepID=UPI003519B4C4
MARHGSRNHYLLMFDPLRSNGKFMPESHEKHNTRTKFYISPTARWDLLSALTKAQAVEQAKGKKHKKLLEQVDLLVMVALIGHRNNQTGRCDPSHATIAREIGVSESTVKRSFKRLIAAGFIAVTARSFKGRQTSSQVDIDFGKAESWITKADEGRSQMSERSVTDDSTLGHGCPLRSVADDLDGRSQMTHEPGERNAEKKLREKNPSASRLNEHVISDGRMDAGLPEGHCSGEPRAKLAQGNQPVMVDEVARKYRKMGEDIWQRFEKRPVDQHGEFIEQFVRLMHAGEIRSHAEIKHGLRCHIQDTERKYQKSPLKFLEQKVWKNYRFNPNNPYTGVIGRRVAAI